MNSKPVNFLATGCSTKPSTVTRREKDGSVSLVECPELVVNYHKGMGGVDVHDQLRLQRYSIQKTVRFRKYYKSLFLGLVDMAIINGYIIHRTVCDQRRETPMLHAEYMNRLHKALLALIKSDTATNINGENLMSTPPLRLAHELTQTVDMYVGGHHQTRRQHLCKV